MRSGCSSPSGRCFGSRSPARKSQLLLQPVYCDDFVCIFFTSSSHEWLCACLVTLTAILFVVTSTGCKRPPVRTSVLEMSQTTSLFVIFAAALLASSFGLMRYSVNKCAFSFQCCCGVSLVHHLCCCASCFFLQSLALQFQQVCSLLLQLLRHFFFPFDLLHRFLCHVLLFLFWRRLFFIVTIIS